MAILRPSSDLITGGWSSTDASLSAAIDETTASDTDYISSSTAGQIARVSLGTYTTSAGTHEVHYRAASPEADRGLIVRLLELGQPPAIVTSKQSWRRQPQGPLRIDWNNPLGRTITHCLPLNGDNRDIVTGNKLTLVNGTIKPTAKGNSLRGSGSNCASIPLNLSAYTKLSISFWLYWDAFANDDDFLMELTTNSNTFNGAFSIDPNASNGFFQIYTRITSTANGKAGAITRPSAASWHHHVWTIDRTAPVSAGITAFVDGIAQSVSYAAANQAGDSTKFASSTLYLFSRAGTSLFGNGNLQNLVFRGGHLMSAAEAAEEYRNAYQIYTPQKRISYFDVPRILGTQTKTYSELGTTGYDGTISVTEPITNGAELALEVEST